MRVQQQGREGSRWFSSTQARGLRPWNNLQIAIARITWGIGFAKAFLSDQCKEIDACGPAIQGLLSCCLDPSIDMASVPADT